MAHPAFTADSTAVITGGASGIGLAMAHRCAALHMNVVLVDTNLAALAEAAQALTAAGAKSVVTSETDVSDRAALVALEAELATRFGGTDVLINNAGIQPGSALFSEEETWQQVIAVNLWGVIHGSRVFAPGMISGGRPGAIINTGSKQGITTPPGDPVYNVAKSGVKAFTEALAHELRETKGHQITAHLLIPGFVYTGLTARGRTEKPAGAWTPEETADFAMRALEQGDFYILCPDNDVSRELDEKRMAWAMGDLIENRPPLSRWHPEWAARFADYVGDDS